VYYLLLQHPQHLDHHLHLIHQLHLFEPPAGGELVPAPPPPADVIVEKIEFEPLTPVAGKAPAPPPPTVIGNLLL
jgi:hypothetical protein